MKVTSVSLLRSSNSALAVALKTLMCALLFVGFVATTTPSAWNPASSAFAADDDDDDNDNNNNNDDDDDDDNNDSDQFRELRWGYREAVGGFMVDANRVLRNANVQELSAAVAAKVAEIPSDLQAPAKERKISLKRLNALVAECEANNVEIPEAARCLGGLTAIEYVVAVPEENDIYLVGPAEPWTVSDCGTLVGKKSGKPVLRLEDLMAVSSAWNGGKVSPISCSIDPTREAIARLTALQMPAPAEELAAAMGQMDVTLQGVPSDSRVANVLAAADYRMKRLSLGFDEAEIKNFASYFSMVKRGSAAYGQRFWMEPKYETVYRDADSLVWKVSDSSVAVLTEREALAKDGSRKATGKADAAANRWAKNMTRRYNELAKAEPIFAEAKNCMDVALVAALIVRENLAKKADCNLDAILGGAVATPEYVVPASVEGDSLVRVSSNAVASVAGGILVNPWATLENDVEVSAELNDYNVTFAGSNWYAD